MCDCPHQRQEDDGVDIVLAEVFQDCLLREKHRINQTHVHLSSNTGG